MEHAYKAKFQSNHRKLIYKPHYVEKEYYIDDGNSVSSDDNDTDLAYKTKEIEVTDAELPRT